MTEKFKRTARSTRTRRLVLLGVLAAAVTSSLLAATGAFAAPAPPAPAITGSSATSTNQTSATFTFTDSQSGVTFLCSLDGSAFAGCTSPKSYAGLAAGSHTFQVEATDGKKASSATSFTWTVDLTAPAAPSVTSSPPNPTNSTSASFSFTGESGASFLCKLDGAPSFTACTSPQSYSSLGAGSHTFQVEQKDTAGNLGPAASSTWTVDTTPPPVPSITGFPVNPANQTSASFSFSDGEGGVTFQCKLDAGAYATCTSPQAYSGLAQGSHTFSVQAKDAAGNLSTAATYTWAVDTTPPPAPSIGSSPPNPSNQSAPSFSFSDTEAGVSFLCKLDAGPFTSCTGPKGYSGLAVGSHTFQVEAKDTAGNVSSATSYTWTIDLTPPPAPSIGTHPADPTNATSASFSFTDSESGVTFACQLDIGVPAPCTSPKAYTALSDGSHTFTVWAKDAAGNQTSSDFTWTVDTTPPAAPSITAFPANPTNATSASFSFTGEAGATFLCSLDGSAFGTCTSPKSYSGLAAGSHTFRVEAKDAVGDTGSPAAYTWAIDLTAPTVSSLNSTDPNPANAGPLRWTVTFSEPVTGVGTGNFGLATSGLGGNAPTIATAVAVGGAPSATWTVTASATGTSGSNSGSIQLNLTVKSPIVDGAGNALGGTPPFAGQAYTFDTTPPAAPSIANGPPQLPGWTTTTSASFSFTGDAGVTFLCSTNSTNQADFTSCSSPKSYSGVAQGPNTFYVEARDAAGNVSSIALRQWTVDSIPPAAPTFTLAPPDPNSVSTSHFDWTPHLPAVDVDHYLCSVENNPSFSTTVPSAGGPAQPCTPPLSYVVGTTNNGQHQFAVEAVDAAGNVGPAIFYSWKVAAGSIQDFTIDGNATGLIYPGGVAQPIAVTLHNPNDIAIYVTALTVSAAMDTPHGCSHNDLVLTQADLTTAASSPNAIVVPPNGSVTLPAQGVAAPTIRLLDNGADQTPACAGQTFSLGYSGSAHS